MPLFWFISNFMLLVILLVVVLMFGVSYYNFSYLELSEEGKIMMASWW